MLIRSVGGLYVVIVACMANMSFSKKGHYIISLKEFKDRLKEGYENVKNAIEGIKED